MCTAHLMENEFYSFYSSSDFRCHSNPEGSGGIIGFLTHLFLNVLCLSEGRLLNYRTDF